MSKYIHPLDYAKSIRDRGFAAMSEQRLSKRTLQKYLWLGTIPEEIQRIIRQFESIFTARVLMNTFASRQKHFEKENWKYLRTEIARYLQAGKQHRPRRALNYPKGRAGGSLEQQRKRQQEQSKRPSDGNSTPQKPVCFLEELSTQERLRERLATWVEVGNGEVRIKYYNAEDLVRITEIIEGPRDDLDSLISARRGDVGEARFL